MQAAHVARAAARIFQQLSYGDFFTNYRGQAVAFRIRHLFPLGDAYSSMVLPDAEKAECRECVCELYSSRSTLGA